MSEKKALPNHVAIIMDGNGRWAKKKGMPRVVGHNAGMKAMKKIVRHASDMGIKYLTVYAFSTENWRRSEEEIGGIFKLLIRYVDTDLGELNRNNVKVKVIGDYKALPKAAVERLNKTIATTKDNTGMQFNIALNYGSRREIVDGVKSIGRAVAKGQLDPELIDEELISSNIFTGQLGIPDPDLVIRTSGEQRISNFLLWQMAYSEILFVETLWPEFTTGEFENAIWNYQNRDRRFGGRKK